jgi:hypothetical protein
MEPLRARIPIGALEKWNDGITEYRRVGVSEEWGIGVSEYWSNGVGMKPKQPVFGLSGFSSSNGLSSTNALNEFP